MHHLKFISIPVTMFRQYIGVILNYIGNKKDFVMDHIHNWNTISVTEDDPWNRCCSFTLLRLCLNLEPALPWDIYIDPALATIYLRRCQEFGHQKSIELVCRRRGMQLALLCNEPDYLTCNPTSRPGTGYTSTWPRPSVEPVWIRVHRRVLTFICVFTKIAGVVHHPSYTINALLHNSLRNK